MKKKKWAVILSGAAVALVLGACGNQGQTASDEEIYVRTILPDSQKEETDSQTAEGAGDKASKADNLVFRQENTGQSLVFIDDGAVPLYSKPQGSLVRVPTASGSVTYGNSTVAVDASNVQNGYVMIKYMGSVNKIKVQISKGGLTYTYDLNARNAYEVFPMSEGDGTYSIKVFENVSGNQYSQAFSQDVSVTLLNQFEPFLYPNQYINFSSGSAAVQKGAEIAASAPDALGVVNNVYNYVVNNTTYDTNKAATVQSGYLPNVDQVLAARTGICFDYAALMVSMLRSQDIPAKLVVGYTGSAYHAWVNVYIDGVGWIDNYIYFDGTNWSLADPTFASTGGQSESIKQYIGNGSNYQQKYCY